MKVLPPRGDTERSSNPCTSHDVESSCEFKECNAFSYPAQYINAEYKECLARELRSCVDVRVEDADDRHEESIKDISEESEDHDVCIGSTKVIPDWQDDDFIDIQKKKTKDSDRCKSIDNDDYEEKCEETFLTLEEKKKVIKLLSTDDSEKWKLNFERSKKIHKNKEFQPFEVHVPSERVLEYVIDTEPVVHTSYNRIYHLPIPFLRIPMEYKHHRSEMKQTESTYTEFESNGNVGNLLEGQPIAHFRYHHRTYKDLENSSLYDYEMGVSLVVHPEMFSEYGWDVQGINKRAEQCQELLKKDYYSFPSLNCESVVTFLLKGTGYSRQLDKMSWKMWMFCDGLDHLCYYKWFLFVLLSTISMPATKAIMIYTMLILLFCIDEEQNRHLLLKPDKYYKRQLFKYIGSFVLRSPLILLQYSFVALFLSQLFLPLFLGLIFNMVWEISNATENLKAHILCDINFTFLLWVPFGMIGIVPNDYVSLHT